MELKRALDLLLEVSAGRDLGRCQPCVVHDTNNNGVWIHAMKGSKARSCFCRLRMPLRACGEQSMLTRV